MTALEDIEEAIETMEASLATDFMTNAVRDIMHTAVQRLKERFCSSDGTSGAWIPEDLLEKARAIGKTRDERREAEREAAANAIKYAPARK